MSAVRTKPNRSNMTALSSPYARRTQKSSWSLSGLLSYLNPLRFRGSVDEESLSSDAVIDVDEEEPRQPLPPSPAQTLSKRGQQLSENISNGHVFPGPPPPSQQFPGQGQDNASKFGLPNVEFTFKAGLSPSRNLDTVSNFLVEHANQPIAPEDINQMVALIQQSKPGVSPPRTLPEYPIHEGRNEEPFRFESRAATTPPRSKSPTLPPRSASATPRTLTRNPNGSYTWKGAGSARARRSQNSFSSPAFRTNRFTAFRTSSASASGEVVGNDTKRRKVEDTELQISQVPNGTTQNRVRFPITSTPVTSRTTTTSLKPPASASVRQRTPVKPTAPVIPSPLRWAWTGDSPSGSESGSPQGLNPLRQTETAKHVTELVNSLKSHDKVLDELRNPYEMANPVKRPAAPKRKRVTAPAKKAAATVPTLKEDEATKVKIKEMSAHAIIEATIPEGSKRSRPPPDLEKTAPRGRETLKVTDDEDEIRAPKRPKPLTNGHAAKECGDIEMQPPQLVTKETKEKPAPIKVPVISVPPSQSSASVKTLFGPKSSMPKEPSKLRFSMQPESTSTPPSPVPEPKDKLEVAPRPTPLPIFTFDATVPAAPPPEKKEIAPTTNLLPGFALPSPTPVTAAPIPKSAKDSAKTQSPTSLPTFTFTFPLTSSGNTKAQDEAKVMDKASLPVFDLTKAIVPPIPMPTTSQKSGFDWGAAGMKAPVTSTGDEWTCNGCMLKNPASATTKCTICDAPKAGAETPKTQTSFDWNAAGMKPSAGPSNDEWACDQCSLKNPATAITKCTICDTPRPGAAADPPKPAVSFNWAAANIEIAAVPAEGEWVCSECSLKNPATATNQCTICDAPKAGATTSMPKPMDFDWGAAGMKAPVSSDASL